MNKTDSVAARLNSIMKQRGLKQVDVLNLAKPYCEKYNIKLAKNYLSQYCNGKNEPGKDILNVLSLALNVNPAWLQGFDVPQSISENDSETDLNTALNPTLSDKKSTTKRKNEYKNSDNASANMDNRASTDKTVIKTAESGMRGLYRDRL